MEQDKKDKFIELRAKGLSFEAISKEINTSKPTLLKLNKELAADIDRLKFINMESLAERYKMLKVSRLESFGKILEKVETAIEAADFNKLSLERLIEFKFKLIDRIKAELSLPYVIEKGALDLVRETDNIESYNLSID